MANQGQNPNQAQTPAEVTPGLSTLLKWGAKHPSAPLIGLCAAAAIIIVTVQRGSSSETLAGILVAVAALVSFVWAMWLLQKYRSAPRPAKLLAWCICLSGGLVFLAGALKLAMMFFGIECFGCGPFPQPLGCEDESSWVTRKDYNAKVFHEKAAAGFYPARLYGRERSAGLYEVCAIWAPKIGPFASYNWLTPSQFSGKHQQLKDYALVSFDAITLQDKSVAIQATWVKRDGDQ